MEVLKTTMDEESVNEIAHHPLSDDGLDEEDEPSLMAKMFISVLIAIMVSVFFLGM